MNYYHIGIVLGFALLTFLIYRMKGIRRGICTLLGILFLGLFTLDYSVTLFRGIGLVKSDFSVGSTIPQMWQYLRFFEGIRFWLFILGLGAGPTVAWLGVLVKNSLRKKGNTGSFAKCIPLLTGGIGAIVLLGALVITDYPVETQLFRWDTMGYTKAVDPKLEWFERDGLICHALGSIDEYTLTNSYNALESNYAKGFRTFEGDIAYTLEGIPVMRHDWDADYGQWDDFGTEEGIVPTCEQFKSALIYDRYVPLTLAEVYKFMEKKSDMFLVLDVKLTAAVSVKEQFEKIVATAEENDCMEVLDRLVVQLYYYDMYDEVMDVYPFKHFLFTQYLVGMKPVEEMGPYLKERGIKVLTTPIEYSDVITMSKDYAPYDVCIYTHTLNDPVQADYLMENGLRGIYTDSVLLKR